jgi:protein arginine kinase activator
MLCDHCKKNEATINFAQVADDKKLDYHLCENCAEKLGFKNPLKAVPFPLGDFLSSMVDKDFKEKTGALVQINCTQCGLTFAEFSKTGKFGCGRCYRAFKTQLDDLLRKIHGSNRHIGNLPHGTSESMEPLRKERELQDELRSAIRNEEFEKAAEIRDQLKLIGSEE